jgi:hypothetical protein
MKCCTCRHQHQQHALLRTLATAARVPCERALCIVDVLENSCCSAIG